MNLRIKNTAKEKALLMRMAKAMMRGVVINGINTRHQSECFIQLLARTSRQGAV